MEQETTYRQELRLKILDTAMMLFKQRGVKKVRMDDIAQLLSVSKRTLYEIYENKEQLLLEGLAHEEQDDINLLHEFSKEATNEMEIMMEILKRKLQALGTINPLFFSEVHKYESVVNFLREKHQNRRERTLKFFDEGVQKGYFRKGVNFGIAMQMVDAVVNDAMETKLYEKYPLKEIFINYVDIMLRGLCTIKGLELLETHPRQLKV